ncbi:Dual specificity protein phosphatase 18 [Operophtera brumata]|uniref:Dual specificity protein phosphatase 18 n=1 Tax=Operophtera brumata TaxID=104452 RepID=A0A0L7KUI1_OPEBR|nr:Dual specificity protein phosphatase 18 [Operophtera brumata]
MKVLTAADKVTNVGNENEPTVVLESQKLTKEELNRGCPLGVSRITNYLYVCGAHALPGAVRVLHPGLIVSAAPELGPSPEDYVPRHFIPLLDTPNSDMHPYMERTADLINEVVANGEIVLVHCVAGVSRSVTLCLAYLVKWLKMTLRDAYHHMKQRRPQIRPNTGFFKQLIKYEERLFGEASVKMVYCEAIDKEIPDVYEPDYIAMTWFRQRYGPIEQH